MGLANIATTTQSDRTLVALLTKTIAEISNHFTTLTTMLLTAQSENACIKISEHILANAGDPDNHGHRSANVGDPSNYNHPRDQISIQGASKSSTPTVIVHLTGLGSRKPILLRRAPDQLTTTTNWQRYWILM